MEQFLNLFMNFLKRQSGSWTVNERTEISQISLKYLHVCCTWI